MFTRLRKDVQIEDLRNHPAELMTSLQDLLAGDVKVVPDPKRDGFYEVEDRARTYYIHVSPVTGKILLLASWPNDNTAPGATKPLDPRTIRTVALENEVLGLEV